MPFGRKSKLSGPVKTFAGKADLSSAQHVLLDRVLGMCCELYNAVLEAWRYQYQWHQSRHKYDGVKLGDVYDDGRIAGGRGVLYAQFSELHEEFMKRPGAAALLAEAEQEMAEIGNADDPLHVCAAECLAVLQGTVAA